MPMVRCAANEHFYNSDEHADCPYCRKTRKVTVNSTAATSPPQAAPTPTPTPAADKGPGTIRMGRSPADPDIEPIDPAVGWLLVVDGPGMGRDCRLIAGMNNIGRARDQDVCLDFGDETISGEAHAKLAYDIRSRRFFLAEGGGKNLVYVNGDLLLGEKHELAIGDRIQLGNTALMFVAACGEHFSWDDA